MTLGIRGLMSLWKSWSKQPFRCCAPSQMTMETLFIYSWFHCHLTFSLSQSFAFLLWLLENFNPRFTVLQCWCLPFADIIWQTHFNINQVKVNTVLGSAAPPLTVKLVRAFKIGAEDSSIIDSKVSNGLFPWAWFIDIFPLIKLRYLFERYHFCFLIYPHLLCDTGASVWLKKWTSCLEFSLKACRCGNIYICFWGIPFCEVICFPFSCVWACLMHVKSIF